MTLYCCWQPPSLSPDVSWQHGHGCCHRTASPQAWLLSADLFLSPVLCPHTFPALAAPSPPAQARSQAHLEPPGGAGLGQHWLQRGDLRALIIFNTDLSPPGTAFPPLPRCQHFSPRAGTAFHLLRSLSLLQFSTSIIWLYFSFFLTLPCKHHLSYMQYSER